MKNYRKALSKWPEETLQRYPNSLSEGFRHTNRLHMSDQSVGVSSTKEQLSKKERESVKLERKAQITQSQKQWAISRFLDTDLLCLQPTV